MRIRVLDVLELLATGLTFAQVLEELPDLEMADLQAIMKICGAERQSSDINSSMKLWIDAHLSPNIAGWIASTFGVEATTLRELGLRDATDLEIFAAAREASAIVVTKDSDFVDLVKLRGTPPQVLWLTCGNTSNAALK